MFWNRSAFQSSNAYEWLPPALFTSTSTRPNVSSDSSIRRSHCSTSRTSVATTWARWPVASCTCGGDPLEVLHLAAGQHDVGAVLGEEHRGRRTDPGATAGDHCDLTGVVEDVVHRPTVRHRDPSAPPARSLSLPAMCGCIVALAAFISPRLAVFFLWLFTDRMSIAFDSFWWGFLGFIFLPWTTLAWAVAYAPDRGRQRLRLVHRDLRLRRRHHDPRRQRAGAPAAQGPSRLTAMIPIGWFGVGSGAFADAEGVGEIARTAEQLGYESIWVGEHPVLIDPHEPPSPLPSHSELMDPVPVLAYAAAVTSRIKLGTGVLLLPHAQPAHPGEATGHDRRVVAGPARSSASAWGTCRASTRRSASTSTRRGRIADEWIDALRTLWHDDQPELRGEFASFGGIQCRPQPVQPGGPPILGSGM